MNESRISNSALIGIFIILGGLTIGIKLSSLPQWMMIIEGLLVFSMWCILISISSLPRMWTEYRNKKRRNKLAKKYFEKFKHDNFVDSFERLQGSEYDYTFPRIIDRLKQYHEEFQSLPELKIDLIRHHFDFWCELYHYFETKIDYDNFLILLTNFSSIVRKYHRICIDESLDEISQIKKTNSIQIKDPIKQDWKTALGYYDDFEKRYNNFLAKVNGEFKGKIIPGRIPPGKEL